MAFHPANFGLPRPFRYRVKQRHETPGRTDRQTDTAHHKHFIMPLSLIQSSYCYESFTETVVKL